MVYQIGMRLVQKNLQQPSEHQTSLVFKWHLNTGLKSPVIEWLCCVITILMLFNCRSYVIPFEYRTHAWYSDGYCILTTNFHSFYVCLDFNYA